VVRIKTEKRRAGVRKKDRWRSRVCGGTIGCFWRKLEERRGEERRGRAWRGWVGGWMEKREKTLIEKGRYLHAQDDISLEWEVAR
jgi:hypothetical protein